MTGTNLPARAPVRPGALLHATAARRWAVDVAIAAAVAAVQVGGAYAATSWDSHGGHHFAGIVTYVLLAVGGASLLGRRRYPVAVLAVTLATALWADVPARSVVWLALIVAFFNAVLERKRAAAVASLVIGYAVSVWPWLIGQRGHFSAGSGVWLAVFMLFMLSTAEIIRSRSQRKAALERSRTEEFRRRAGEERMRMARDLHDVVAHNISVINVQANTALHLMDRQPEHARSALTNINDVSKQALVELRSVLGVLRDVDDPAPLKPSPGLARLGDLVNNAATAGLTVRIRQEGQPAPLPADVDLAAYRVVQEALTNSARHSGGDNATVRVVYGADALVVEVKDQGAVRPPGRPPVQANGSGNGITGMTERATALGGTLRAGRRPEGGFEVRAWLPLHRNDR